MDKSILIDYFSGMKKITTTAVSKFFKKHPELKKEIEHEVEIEPCYVDVAHYIIFAANDMQLKKCKVCGKTLLATKPDSVYCSYECKRKDPDLVEKMKKTCIDRYGVSNPGKAEAVKEKMRKTSLERYGVENAAKSKAVQDKMKKTCLERYGVEHAVESANVREKIQKTFDERYDGNPNKSADVRAKIKSTCLERYGVEYSFQDKDVIEKAVATRKKNGSTRNQLKSPHNWNSDYAKKIRIERMIERYGVENPMQDPSIREKARATMNERFGGDYPVADPAILEKMKRSRYDLTYFRNLLRFKGIVEPMFTREEFHGAGDHLKRYMWRCCKCGSVFEDHCYSHVPRCLKCNPHLSATSFMEIEVIEFVKSLFPNAHKDRKLIRPKELDCVIDELKLAIEFNGKFWHSVERGKGDGYHLKKTLMCNEKGYRLIHVWEDEWIDHKEELKERLLKVLTGAENLAFTDDTLKLDRSWYNGIDIPGYELVEEVRPAVEVRHGYDTENCGWLVYKKRFQ